MTREIYRVSFRAHFDDRLTAKENKDALKNSVQEALAELGLAIDEGDVKFHHRKLVRKKNKKPKFVVMGLDVVEGTSAEKMKASPAFGGACGGGRGETAWNFTVRWGERTDVEETETETGQVLKSINAKNIVKSASKDAGKRAPKSATTPAAVVKSQETISSLGKHERHASAIPTNPSMSSISSKTSMTATLLAGVVCAVGLGGALLMSYHHLGGIRWGRGR